MNRLQIKGLVESFVNDGLTAKQLSESLPKPSNRLLAESYDTFTAEPAALGRKVSTDPDDELKRDYIQYVKSGNSFSPVGEVTLVDSLGPCAYQVNLTMSGPKFERIKPKTDELMVFENSSMQKVVQEIDRFWDRKVNYQNLGLMHSRGILMYGPPGTGKSACLQQVVEMMVKRGDVVFFAKSSEAVVEGLKAFRQVEPERRVVVCFEEADELVRYNERALLQLMDGDAKTDNVLFLATTNYIDRLPPRMLRPGRFDKKIYIAPPNYEARLKYLRHKLNKLAEDTKIVDLARKSDGFGFGHMRELIAGVFAMGEPMEEVLTRLRAPIQEGLNEGKGKGNVKIKKGDGFYYATLTSEPSKTVARAKSSDALRSKLIKAGYAIIRETGGEFGRDDVFGPTARSSRPGSFQVPREVIAQAQEIIQSHALGAEADAGFDAGEWSGPAHADMEEKALRQLAAANNVDFDDLMVALQYGEDPLGAWHGRNESKLREMTDKGRPSNVRRSGTGKSLWKSAVSKIQQSANKPFKVKLKGGSVKVTEPSDKPGDPFRGFRRWSLEALRPFTKTNWYGYAGAQRPEPGSLSGRPGKGTPGVDDSPMIDEISLDGLDGTIIVDRGAVQVLLLGPNDEDIVFHLDTPFAQGKALAAQLIREQPPIDRLKEFGFNRIM
jgi:hypothetical protein